jgi:hypothetical protein
MASAERRNVERFQLRREENESVMSTFRALPLGMLGLVMLSLTACGAAPVDSSEAEAMLEEEDLGSTQAALTDEIQVGVIPGRDQLCAPFPGSNEKLRIHLENEHEDNHNLSHSWRGRFESLWMETELIFCSVSSAGFRRPKGDADDSYAVLKLGDKCPSGSKTMSRYFDLEDYPCGKGGPFGGGIIGSDPQCGTKALFGDVAPTTQDDTNVRLQLCVFEGHSGGSSDPFPSLGNVEWGVFGGGGRESDSRGWVYSDDEDDGNNNSVDDNGVDYRAIMETGRNTKLFLHRINRVD